MLLSPKTVSKGNLLECERILSVTIVSKSNLGIRKSRSVYDNCHRETSPKGTNIESVIKEYCLRMALLVLLVSQRAILKFECKYLFLIIVTESLLK